MSKDLFAEFGSFDESLPPTSSETGTTALKSDLSFFNDLSSLNTSYSVSGVPQLSANPAAHGQPATGDDAVDAVDDDWGDFEDASAGNGGTTAPKTVLNSSAGREDTELVNSLRSLSVSAGHTERPGHSHALQDGMKAYHQSATQNLGTTSLESQPKTGNRIPLAVPQKPNRVDNARAPDEANAYSGVLFDATEPIEDDDDFGDFETDEASQVKDAKPTQPPSNLVDLWDEPFPAQKLPTAPVLQSKIALSKTAGAPRSTENGASLLDDLDPLPTGIQPARKEPPKPKPSPRKPAVSDQKIAKPAAAEEDTWEVFGESDAWEPVEPTASGGRVSEGRAPVPLTAASSIPEEVSGGLPPTNIPPPAVLLPLFPPLFKEAQKKLFQPLATQSQSVKDRILSDPATERFLNGYLAISVVCAYVIAGRKLRWKRDSILSQSMRIGPASGGRSSGMKLTGIDKAEANKEDREVLDVVRAWREQVGRLRSSVVAAKAHHLQIRPSQVPDIQENIPVKAVKELEGGVTAPRPCALCGLKRDERVHKVDTDIEDSFGEYWNEQVSMHVVCRNFWQEHQKDLGQR